MTWKEPCYREKSVEMTVIEQEQCSLERADYFWRLNCERGFFTEAEIVCYKRKHKIRLGKFSRYQTQEKWYLSENWNFLWTLKSFFSFVLCLVLLFYWYNIAYSRTHWGILFSFGLFIFILAHTQLCSDIIPNSALLDHSWRCSRYHTWCQWFNLTVHMQGILPSILWLWSGSHCLIARFTLPTSPSEFQDPSFSLFFSRASHIASIIISQVLFVLGIIQPPSLFLNTLHVRSLCIYFLTSVLFP